MVTGPFINASAVLVGGVLGALLSQRLPERIRTAMTSIFGLASLGIGILLVIKCANLPVMVLSTLVGTLLGEICNMEKGINTLVSKLQQLMSAKGKKKASAHESYIQSYVAIIVLFCAIPMVAWAATLIAMKGYALTGEKMKEIQAVNACRRDAVAKGMKLDEAIAKWQSMDQLPAEYRS